MPRISPKTETTAFFIWADCRKDPAGWNRTIPEIAQSCGFSTQRTSRAITLKGWTNRVRVSSRDIDNSARCSPPLGDGIIGMDEDDALPRELMAAQ